MHTGFGAALRERRLAAGLSLNALAARIHYSKGYLSKVETGVKPAGEDFARRADAALGAGGALLALVLPPQAQDDGSWRRRDVLVGGAAGLLAAGAGPGVAAGPGIGVGAPALAAVARDGATAAAYTAMLADLRALAQHRPPAMVLPLLALQVQALDALARVAPAAGRPALLLAASRYAEFSGWMAQETGDPHGMAQWTARAVEFAEAGGDQELAAYAHVRHANAAMYRGDAAGTVELARAAVDRVRTARDVAPSRRARVQGLALAREAQGHALLGDQEACLRALERASATFAGAASGADQWGTANASDPVDLARGWALHDLGRPAEAIPVLERHLAALSPAARRARARAGGRLALAWVGVGETGAAIEVADRVLQDAVVLDSATLREDLHRLNRSLTRWRTRPEVQHLSLRLGEALRSVPPASSP